MFQYLVKEKGYTENDAEETLLRYEAGMELPSKVLKDIREFERRQYERSYKR